MPLPSVVGDANFICLTESAMDYVLRLQEPRERDSILGSIAQLYDDILRCGLDPFGFIAADANAFVLASWLTGSDGEKLVAVSASGHRLYLRKRTVPFSYR
jgi:hypothetical protein